MPTVVFSGQSGNDIIDIWQQVASHGRRIADNAIDKIEARCGQLADFPELGPLRPEIADGVRTLVSERWLIIYRLIDGNVLVVRIIDGARDLSNLNLPNE